MATLATSVRQPFGVLDDTKIRHLQSLKNRQNAVASQPASSLKRRAPSPELSDSENIDPGVFESSVKRKRGCIEDDISRAKSVCRNRWDTTTDAKPYLSRSGTVTTVTPQPSASVTAVRTTPCSAPAAAGRSPTRLMGKPTSRRRFAPPMIRGMTSPSLSLSAALRGTLAHKKVRPAAAKRATSLADAKPKSWSFDIFEETEEHQEYKMSEWTMVQNSAALDLSDRQNRSLSPEADGVKSNVDEESKENVDPNAVFGTLIPDTASLNAVVTTHDSKPSTSDGSRTPLGDLNAADFYADGLSATSVVLVQDEIEDDVHQNGVADDVQKRTLTASAHPDHVVDLEIAEKIPEWAQRSSTVLADDTVENSSDGAASNVAQADIEIWESESAKDENEGDERENICPSIVVEAGETVCVSAFVLQEL